MIKIIKRVSTTNAHAVNKFNIVDNERALSAVLCHIIIKGSNKSLSQNPNKQSQKLKNTNPTFPQ